LPFFSALEHALAILGVDEATAMAPGGGEQRAEAMASLSGMLHRQATDPKLAGWIARRQGRGSEPRTRKSPSKNSSAATST
jgi:Zn-dependent M32 family carboxypeptidase